MKNKTDTWHILDFTDSEKRVVHALREHGAQSVSGLAQNANIPRSTADSALRNLRERKLVRRVSKGYASIWRLVRPEDVETALDTVAETLGVTDAAREIEQTIGVKVSESTEVFVYHGMERILKVYEHFLFGLRGKRIYAIETPSAVLGFMEKVSPKEAIRFNTELTKRRVIIEAVFPRGIKDAYRTYAQKHPELPRAYIERPQAMRLVPDELLPGTMEMVVVNDTVLVANYWEELLIVIQNREMVTLFKALYSLMYSVGESFDQAGFMRELAEEFGGQS